MIIWHLGMKLHLASGHVLCAICFWHAIGRHQKLIYNLYHLRFVQAEIGYGISQQPG